MENLPKDSRRLNHSCAAESNDSFKLGSHQSTTTEFDLAEGEELEAAHVYLLLKKDLRISRNLRAEWYLEHLNTVITVPRRTNIVSEILIISEVHNTNVLIVSYFCHS